MTWCPACRRGGRDFDPVELAQRFGEDAIIDEIAKRMVCSNPECRHRGAETRLNSKAAMKVKYPGASKTPSD